MSEKTFHVLGNSVYAEVSNNMIGLSAAGEGDGVWLSEPEYEALKRTAQLLNWEPIEELASLEIKESKAAQLILEEIRLANKSLEAFSRNAGEYLQLEKGLTAAISPLETLFTWSMMDLNIHFSGTGTDLAKVFRFLRANGLKLETDRPKANSSQWNGRFAKRQDGEKLLSVYIFFTSTVCQIRKIREELKLVPVYETVCDQGTSIEDLNELGEGVQGAEAPAEPLSDFDDDIPF